jgi:hypothetical protein
MEKHAIISEEWIKDLIRNFIAGSPLNTMQTKEREPAWDTALVRFASGADPIWQQYKEYIGAFDGPQGEPPRQDVSIRGMGQDIHSTDAAPLCRPPDLLPLFCRGDLRQMH